MSWILSFNNEKNRWLTKAFSSEHFHILKNLHFSQWLTAWKLFLFTQLVCFRLFAAFLIQQYSEMPHDFPPYRVSSAAEKQIRRFPYFNIHELFSLAASCCFHRAAEKSGLQSTVTLLISDVEYFMSRLIHYCVVVSAAKILSLWSEAGKSVLFFGVENFSR